MRRSVHEKENGTEDGKLSRVLTECTEALVALRLTLDVLVSGESVGITSPEVMVRALPPPSACLCLGEWSDSHLVFPSSGEMW